MADSMTDTSGEMSPAQARIFATVPDGWANIPFIGVHEAILRALKGRCLVETRYADGGVRQWRRVVPEPPSQN